MQAGEAPKKKLTGFGKAKPGKSLNPKASHTTFQTGKHGLPLPTPKPMANFFGHIDSIPIDPTDTSSVRERNLAKVEVCLLKGITSATRISNLVGVSWETAKAYIETIQTRWAMRGSVSRLKMVRGEALHRIDLIAEELWVMYQDTSNPAVVRTQCLKYLQDAHDRRCLLENLTPVSLARLDAEEPDAGEDKVDDRIRDHQRNLTLARALLEFVGQCPTPEPDTGTIIEAEYVEVPRPKPAE